MKVVDSEMSEFRYTIASCFFNSTRRLDPYFAALRRLDMQGEDVELVFVDNASTDATLEELRARSAALSVPVQILSEVTPGLMHARRTATRAARGEFILFLDDDNEPEPDYLKHLSRLLNTYPDAALFTGNCILPDDYPANLRTMQTEYRLLVIRRLQGEFMFELNTLAPQHLPWGAGLFGRRTELAAACEQWANGGMDIVGRRGEQLSGGEDIWLAHYLTRYGRRAVFSDRLTLRHRIDPERFQADYMTRLGLANGIGHLAVVEGVRVLKPELRHPHLGVLHSIRIFFAALPVSMLRAMLRPDVTRLANAASFLGYSYALLRRLRERS